MTKEQIVNYLEKEHKNEWPLNIVDIHNCEKLADFLLGATEEENVTEDYLADYLIDLYEGNVEDYSLDN